MTTESNGATADELRTVRQISAECGVEGHKITYAILRARVQPAIRAGSTFLYDASATKRIKVELERIRHREELR